MRVSGSRFQPSPPKTVSSGSQPQPEHPARASGGGWGTGGKAGPGAWLTGLAQKWGVGCLARFNGLCCPCPGSLLSDVVPTPPITRVPNPRDAVHCWADPSPQQPFPAPRLRWGLLITQDQSGAGPPPRREQGSSAAVPHQALGRLLRLVPWASQPRTPPLLPQLARHALPLPPGQQQRWGWTRGTHRPAGGLPRLSTCCVTAGRTLSLSGPHAMFQELLDSLPELFPIREPTPGQRRGRVCAVGGVNEFRPRPRAARDLRWWRVGGVALSHPPAAAGAHRSAPPSRLPRRLRDAPEVSGKRGPARTPVPAPSSRADAQPAGRAAPASSGQAPRVARAARGVPRPLPSRKPCERGGSDLSQRRRVSGSCPRPGDFGEVPPQ